MKYYIKGNYYFDIDLLNQFRITGPGNHLFLGWAIPKDVIVAVTEYEFQEGYLHIELSFSTTTLKTAKPLVSDIRTLRKYTEQVTPRPTYDELVTKGITEVLPHYAEVTTQENRPVVEVFNQYYEEGDVLKKYGVQIIFPSNHRVTLTESELSITAPQSISCIIKVVGNIESKSPSSQIFREKDFLENLKDNDIRDLFHQCQTQIEHLISTEKTSSFEYGTIFPRDWIESADLGRNDFTPSTVDFMYQESMKHVSEQGEGWHEDIIGQLKSTITDQSQHIDRKMIDIEPRYIMGFYNLSKNFLMQEQNREKLYLVSQYLLRNAEQQDLITFKKVSNAHNQYHFVGNWRDSYLAFPRQKSPLAPYDVNCVFYPVSLRIIRRYAQYFYITNIEMLNGLIEKWDQQKSKFRLFHPDGIVGYALALHGKKNRPVATAHLDEAYDMYYGTPSLEEVASFAKKLNDPEYFYTPVGPLLVASDDDDLSTQQYHGKVIWPKQAAYAVAGLAKQHRRGQREYWPWEIMNLIRESIMKTCQACFRGWKELSAVPELYYYDESADRARFYTDQETYEGQMSLVQLWSAVGCRRIVREYVSFLEEL